MGDKSPGPQLPTQPASLTACSRVTSRRGCVGHTSGEQGCSPYTVASFQKAGLEESGPPPHVLQRASPPLLVPVWMVGKVSGKPSLVILMWNEVLTQRFWPDLSLRESGAGAEVKHKGVLLLVPGRRYVMIREESEGFRSSEWICKYAVKSK